MQFRCASCGLGLIERGILHLKRAYFGIWLKTRGILHLKRACVGLCLIQRGTLHFTLEARFLWFMAYRTRNIALKRACFCAWLIERGMLHLKRASFNEGLIKRGNYISGAHLLVCGL